METPERIWFLLSRSLSGEATPAEKDELAQLLQQQPELMQQYDMLQHLWTVPSTAPEEPGQSDQPDQPDQPDKIRHILQLSAAEETTPAPVIRMRMRYRWTAVLVGCTLLLSAFLIWEKGQDRFGLTEIAAPKGSKTRTILPDGSTVWLNAGSSIVYKDREVTLEGEAFFDVSHATSRTTGKRLPFIVHAGNIDIKVLGTAFNVKSYPDDKTIETTLIRGLVQILRKDGKPSLYLRPNQKIVLDKEKKPRPVVKEPTHITQLDSNLKEEQRVETAWIYNRLEFRGDNFEELAIKLERWYNVRIHFDDEAVRKLKFNGSIESESIEQAFEALKAANSFNVSINRNDIFISSIK